MPADAFMMGLATTLVLGVISHLGLRNMGGVEFVPLILSCIFGFSQLFLGLPVWVLYLSPWNNREGLFFEAFRGSPATVVLTNTGSGTLYWLWSVAGLLGWVAVLVGLASLLLARIRSVSIQEGRQI